MKIKELIEQLSQWDQDMVITIASSPSKGDGTYDRELSEITRAIKISLSTDKGDIIEMCVLEQTDEASEDNAPEDNTPKVNTATNHGLN